MVTDRQTDQPTDRLISCNVLTHISRHVFFVCVPEVAFLRNKSLTSVSSQATKVGLLSLVDQSSLEDVA
jgi:hypothetical protein